MIFFFSEMIGYVDEVLGIKECKNGKMRLFKFYLTNGDKRLAVMIFDKRGGPDLIRKYERDIAYKRVSLKITDFL